LTICFFSIHLQLQLFVSHQTDTLSNTFPLALALSSMIKINDSNSQFQPSGEEESGPFSDVLLSPGTQLALERALRISDSVREEESESRPFSNVILSPDTLLTLEQAPTKPRSRRQRTLTDHTETVCVWHPWCGQCPAPRMPRVVSVQHQECQPPFLLGKGALPNLDDEAELSGEVCVCRERCVCLPDL
jgi:hypothetical protein